MQNRAIGHQNSCQVCRHSPLTSILPLGHQAPVHAHVNSAKLHEPDIRFPLNLCRCPNCGLLQLDYIADPEVIFYPEYPYFSGMTNMLVEDFKELRDTVMEHHGAKPGQLVIDIGSNDGSLLKGFKEKGFNILGVEPTNVADMAIGNGIPTLKEFFTQKTAEHILDRHGRAKVVTATNMFAHVADPFALAHGIAYVLADDGIFVSESQYLMDMIEKSALDTIYHEHLRYYSLNPLEKLLGLVDMTIVDAQRIEAAGGSIRVYAKKGKHEQSSRIKEILQAEKEAGIFNGEAFKNFARKIKTAKQNLQGLLIKCKQEGARIVGVGAPGRSNTLLQYMNIDNSILDYAVEKKGSPKIGLFTPGTHIPIVDEKILFTEQPEYGLLLSWHIADGLTKKLRSLGYKGKFITPLPEPKILET